MIPNFSMKIVSFMESPKHFIRELSRTAKDRHAGSLGYSEAMLIFYNKKNTGGLQMEKLYAKNKKPAPFSIFAENDFCSPSQV